VREASRYHQSCEHGELGEGDVGVHVVVVVPLHEHLLGGVPETLVPAQDRQLKGWSHEVQSSREGSLGRAKVSWCARADFHVNCFNLWTTITNNLFSACLTLKM
jgi:hypothetical protein